MGQASARSETESLSSSVSSEELSWHPSESWSVVELDIHSRSPAGQASAASPSRCRRRYRHCRRSRLSRYRLVLSHLPGMNLQYQMCHHCRRRCPPRCLGIRQNRSLSWNWKSSRGHQQDSRQSHPAPRRCRRRYPHHHLSRLSRYRCARSDQEHFIIQIAPTIAVGIWASKSIGCGIACDYPARVRVQTELVIAISVII